MSVRCRGGKYTTDTVLLLKYTFYYIYIYFFPPTSYFHSQDLHRSFYALVSDTQPMGRGPVPCRGSFGTGPHRKKKYFTLFFPHLLVMFYFEKWPDSLCYIRLTSQTGPVWTLDYKFKGNYKKAPSFKGNCSKMFLVLKTNKKALWRVLLLLFKIQFVGITVFKKEMSTRCLKQPRRYKRSNLHFTIFKSLANLHINVLLQFHLMHLRTCTFLPNLRK